MLSHRNYSFNSFVNNHSSSQMEVRRGNHKNARNLLKIGFTKCGSDVALLAQLARLDLKLGHIESAKELARKGIRMSKGRSSGCWSTLLGVEEKIGTVDSCDSIIDEIFQANTEDAALLNLCGANLNNRGNIAAARDAFEAAIKAEPHYAPTYHSLAELEASIGNLDALAKLNRRINLMKDKTFPAGLEDAEAGAEVAEGASDNDDCD